MTVINIPAYVPEEWTPTKMTRKQYNAARAALVAQKDAATAAEANLRAAWDGSPALADTSVTINESLGTAWNQLHTAVTALEFEIDALDREWRYRNVDPYQRFLVSNNID